jgi:hypothetical protein
MTDDASRSPDWLSIALKQYQSLRDESLTAMSTQQSSLSLGTAALALLAAGAFQVWERESLLATLIFIAFVPLLAMTILWIWMGELARMSRAGNYLLRIEWELQRAFPEKPRWILGWESDLHRTSSPSWCRHSRVNYYAVIVLFGAIAAGSIAAGAYRGTHSLGSRPFPLSDTWVYVLTAAMSAVLVASTIVLILRVASRAETESRPGPGPGFWGASPNA